ncbi:TetR/AcrR family transcriptional regulator [Eoetvoesiella caeni]|nr:TetR/AcrR family transcriptional regulator [Eoetvoesiella caeni]MCI2809095.1 TetR/AcrR family transcriptional regulator [Eoetvoesiella caeni]NYT55404.1 TetR/AcrR family transcriptional regulator [Eoetvoesiella caeni]
MTRTGRPLAMSTEDRKNEIHNAAEQLFGDRGYEKVTMAEIAAQAGMSKKTLYVHFADKEALLKSLVASSYSWPSNPLDSQLAEPVDGLKTRLKTIADHVLSERHLKLCRLAIGEGIGIAGLADTFYRMGIQASRQSLIAAVDQVEPSRRISNLNSDIWADMLFGATIGKVFIDALLTGKRPVMRHIYAGIDHVVATLFAGDLSKN